MPPHISFRRRLRSARGAAVGSDFRGRCLEARPPAAVAATQRSARVAQPALMHASVSETTVRVRPESRSLAALENARRLHWEAVPRRRRRGRASTGRRVHSWAARRCVRSRSALLRHMVGGAGGLMHVEPGGVVGVGKHLPTGRADRREGAEHEPRDAKTGGDCVGEGQVACRGAQHVGENHADLDSRDAHRTLPSHDERRCRDSPTVVAVTPNE